MAATVIGNFGLLVLSCFLAVVYSKSSLYVAHIPDCVSLKEDADPIQSDEIPDIISVALGFTPSKELQWSGLLQGDLFSRPSANVLVTVESVNGGLLKPSFVSSRQYHVADMGAVRMDSVKDSIVKAYGDDRIVYVDLTTDSKDIKLPLKHESILEALPTTLKGISNSLHGDNSVLLDFQQGSLNLSGVADTLLFSELQLFKDFLLKVTENKELTQDGIPDLYSFTISGLRAIQTEYGVESKQAKDAIRIISQFLTEFSAGFAALYHRNALVEVYLAKVDPYVRRQGRSVLATTASPPIEPNDLNIAGTYDEDWPVFFNIFLWLGVILTVTVFAVAYLLWYMDPGDTIIYRMTSQRMKID